MNALCNRLLSLASFADDYPGNDLQFIDVLEVIVNQVDKHSHASIDACVEAIEFALYECLDDVHDAVAKLLVADALEIVGEYRCGSTSP